MALWDTVEPQEGRSGPLSLDAEESWPSEQTAHPGLAREQKVHFNRVPLLGVELWELCSPAWAPDPSRPVCVSY